MKTSIHQTAILCCLAAMLPLVSVHAAGAGEPAAADAAGIQAVLDAYTRSVSGGDQRTFESLLLDQDIPFHGLGDGKFSTKGAAGLASVQNYAGFRQSVFGSGRKLAQRFFDVAIAQEGDLAQVSLRFETVVAATGAGAQGWKTLALLRVDGRWKIASEFYTARALDRQGGAGADGKDAQSK